MFHHATATATAANTFSFDTLPSALTAPMALTLPEELLPFTVRLVRNEADLNKAVQIRHAAYARHLPDFAETLKIAETDDVENGVVVLLAESKVDGSPLGTMRIQTNQYKPLSLEQSIALPEWLKARPLAEATRLGVTNEKGGRLVTTVLFKAYFQYCQQTGIEWMVITARSPVDRTYDRLMFNDVFPEAGYIPIHHVGNLPHRVMSFNVETAEERWAAAKHPMFNFIFRTTHPDIQLDSTRQRFHTSMDLSTFQARNEMLPM
ncbi:MAG: hypothetical protein A2461_00655 [Burkholderiales bacterium RIFOXYC2_FULL_59_8]|nr:MAG: hypothetical protein A2461_00655 [Burkholderiales bacterium RIFOXYC2_FULL_59_8]OGB52029.1 MAG: hypothetical protein A2503_16870 [Burkholderiales bacterium RIFOXYD12_FULL_59_19]OGB67605.1 MAG: hypothetical protein A2496_16695 [Burkholderiales bacterium RIFOXYC12_FULL_60_6]